MGSGQEGNSQYVYPDMIVMPMWRHQRQRVLLGSQIQRLLEQTTLHWKLRRASAQAHPPARARQTPFYVLKDLLGLLKHPPLQFLLAFAAQQRYVDGVAVDAPDVCPDLARRHLGLTYVCTQYKRAAGPWKWLQVQAENSSQYQRTLNTL